jgi:hypothetical protein
MIEEQMTTSAVAVNNKPIKFRDFDVPSEVFRKFGSGRNKFERWSKYLNIEDSNQRAIYDYAKTNPKSVIVLRDESTGVLRAIRRNSPTE